MYTVEIFMVGSGHDDPIFSRDYYDLFDAQTVALIEFRDLIRTNGGNVKDVVASEKEYTVKTEFFDFVVRIADDGDEDATWALRPVNVVHNPNCGEWTVVEISLEAKEIIEKRRA